MSEPASAVPKRMMTRPKNATQHPGHILTEAEGYTKRRTKAQKGADDKREKEEKQASEMATQEGHKHVAAFQKKMQTDQAAIRADAPKPTRPRPHPVKKAVKPVETSNSTVAEDKAVGAKGKGGRAGDKSAAGANVEHPESDAEDEEQEVRVPGARKKKGKRTVLPVKTPVRDAIEAVGLIDESTMPRDDDKKSDDVSTAGPTKFGVAAGRISHWRSSIPAKPSSNAAASKDRRPSTMPSEFSSIAPSSKLTRGSTVSSGGAPLTPINTITGAGADSMADRFVTLFADDDLDESVEHSQALARMSKQKGAAQLTHRNTNLAPKQLNVLQPDTVIDDNGDMDVEVARPAVASLVNYASDTDMESDLEPPPSMQVPKGYYDDDICRAVALNRTPASYPTTPSMNSLSSKVEFMSHIKPVVKIESEPVSLRVTSMTNIGVKHKAPMTKRTKSSVAHTHSLSSISILTHFMSMQDDIETDDDCKDFAKNLLLPLRRHVYSLSRQTTTDLFLVFQMERALDIISGDTRVSELKFNSKGKAVKVPHSLNKVTGKPSSALKAFSDTNYGEVTRGYMKSINRLRESVLQDVWERTKEIAVKRRGAPIILDEDSDDERALIYDDW
ncbi:hypothetical protein F4604DRAFT_1581771 [Suillus subluteus]|nr:hypothetical protein F4604DRAFT_1581600 [Suillus subluteus]KAG1875829.1 hypothetical protein F4604DRAFT_1581771 [Suillus subluteus]